MLYSSRDLPIQTDLPLMYLTAQYYAVSCLPSQQSASSQAVFFLLAHQTDLLPFQCQCIGKSKSSIRYSVQQGSNKNNHMYTEHGYYLMDKSTFSLIYARLFIFSFDWPWFYYLTSLKLFVQRLHQVYIMRCSNCSVKQNMMLHINDV